MTPLPPIPFLIMFAVIAFASGVALEPEIFGGLGR